ncbi:MFS transporter [Metabacillus kandeliae]|uniref:MFS transporter n=1 Tax=Metabacillus kandeliae TaxID=2900151 RepID=UPI0022B24BB4|nr:MFS transporter [Metabacillus kandeliae]
MLKNWIVILAAEQKNRKTLSNVRPFQTFYFSFSFMLAISQGFFLPFLISKDFSNTEIGWILAINTISGIAGQIGTGLLCDWLRRLKGIFILWVILLAGITLVLYYSEMLPVFLAAVILASFFQSALIGLIDSWIIETSTEMKSRFGEIRAFGSLGFGISMIITGYIVSMTGYSVIPYAFGLLSLLLLFVIRPISNPVKEEKNPAIKIKDLFIILQNKRYFYLNMLYILFYILLGMVGLYSVLLIEKAGGSEKHIGVFQAIAAFSEIPMFFLARKLTVKFHYMFLFLAAILMMAGRIAVLSAASDLSLLILSGALQGITMPLFMVASKQLTEDAAFPQYRTTMQMVSIAAYLGIGSSVTSVLAGTLSDWISIRSALMVYLAINVLTLFLGTAYSLKYYKHPQKSGKQKS